MFNESKDQAETVLSKQHYIACQRCKHYKRPKCLQKDTFVARKAYCLLFVELDRSVQHAK